MELPIGYHEFHREKFYNYQLNRLYSLGFARKDEIEQAAGRISSREDYIREFKALAAKAENEGRIHGAAFYLRAVEFFVPHESEERLQTYKRFIELFDRGFADEGITRHEVPYNAGFLPALEMQPDGMPLGTVLVFGGFDSLIEEFFAIWSTFARAGYRVIAFEGPGQGGARLLYGHLFDHDWEKPVGAVLDHFGIEQAALVGISMGGYWSLRAAAFEPRITAVVSWSPVYDWLEQVPGFTQSLIRWMVSFEGFMNATIRLRMRLFPVLDHAVKHAMALTGGDQPMDAVRWMLAMNRDHLNSERVTQDVLLVGGENDAFQPVKLLYKQKAALTNARSITPRIFTAEEHADQHCQMGNLNLVLDEIEDWLRVRMSVPAPSP